MLYFLGSAARRFFQGPSGGFRLDEDHRGGTATMPHPRVDPGQPRKPNADGTVLRFSSYGHHRVGARTLGPPPPPARDGAQGVPGRRAFVSAARASPHTSSGSSVFLSGQPL